MVTKTWIEEISIQDTDTEKTITDYEKWKKENSTTSYCRRVITVQVNPKYLTGKDKMKFNSRLKRDFRSD